MTELFIGRAVESTEKRERKTFIKKTYLHTAGAVALFTGLEYLVIVSGLGLTILNFISQAGWMWFIVLGAFMGVSMLANSMAHSDVSKSTQYAGLGLYVAAEAVIFSPMILMASIFAPGILLNAAALTAFLFTGLTLLAFKGGVDWSFLGKFLAIGSFIALGIIILSMIMGTGLGLWFSGAMILFASGSILYNTSQIMKEYSTTQYVAASLSLFASVALLFWYVLQFLMSMAMDD